MSRTQLVRKVYTYGDGETGRSAKPDWTELTFEFLAPEKDENDNPVVIDTRTVTRAQMDELQDMAVCSMGHGLSQKLGDALAGIAGKAAKEEPPVKPDEEKGFVPYATELWDEAWENISQGVWVAEGEGSGRGASVTILLEAIVAAFADAGQELGEEQLGKLRENLKDEDFRKKAKDRADIAAHMARIAAERAAARAKEAKAKAKGADSSTIGDLIA